MHTPDRNAGPLEGSEARSWSLGIVEQAPGQGLLLSVETDRGDVREDIVVGMPVEESRAAMEARRYC